MSVTELLQPNGKVKVSPSSDPTVDVFWWFDMMPLIEASILFRYHNCFFFFCLYDMKTNILVTSLQMSVGTQSGVITSTL